MIFQTDERARHSGAEPYSGADRDARRADGATNARGGPAGACASQPWKGPWGGWSAPGPARWSAPLRLPRSRLTRADGHARCMRAVTPRWGRWTRARTPPTLPLYRLRPAPPPAARASTSTSRCTATHCRGPAASSSTRHSRRPWRLGRPGPDRKHDHRIHRPCVAKVQLAGLFEPESYCSFYFRTWNRGPSRKLEMDSKLNFEIGNNSKSVTMLTHHCRGAAARARPRSRAAVIGSKSRTT